jgi:signal transduction histidine kinase
MLDAKRALLLAISHELRSPLTRARLNAELVDDGAERRTRCCATWPRCAT